MFGNAKRRDGVGELEKEQLRILYEARDEAVKIAKDAEVGSTVRKNAEEDAKTLTDLINAIEQNGCKKSESAKTKAEKSCKVVTSIAMLCLWAATMYIGVQTDITTEFLPYKSMRTLARDLATIVSKKA